jgi:dipeptidyl aminopeptidase/acylaminoacyl peptidase
MFNLNSQELSHNFETCLHKKKKISNAGSSDIDISTFYHDLGSFFTEKYFGYNRMIGHSLQEADLSLQASNFLSKNYLLIHGTADTLVHQQHTMLLTKSLIQKGVIFRHQVSEKKRGKEKFLR